MNKEKAIAIAKDVLQHLDALQVKTGHYFKSECSMWEIAPTGDLKDYIEKVQQGCSVCAFWPLPFCLKHACLTKCPWITFLGIY